MCKCRHYNLFRHDRNTAGGHLALYVHNSLSATRSCTLFTVGAAKPGHPEYLFCEVTPRGGSPIFTGLVYRPPHAPFVKGTDFIHKLTTHMQDYSTIVIVGDFNADQLNMSGDNSRFLGELIEENLLHSISFSAAHHISTADTMLELCLVDANDSVIDFWKFNL